jgi:hypothetical protein
LAPVLFAALPLLAGCSISKLAADNMVPILTETKNDFNRETVVQFGREAAPGLLGLLNGIVQASPDNPDLRLLQAEMSATFAFGFLEEENVEWATSLYQKAQVAALIALADEDEDFAKALPRMKPQAIEAALADMDEDAVGALFWWGFARGSEINLHRDDPKLILDLDRVDVVMAWVLKTDETYFNAGPHLFFAIRHTMLPKTLGGKPEIGLEHFVKFEKLTKGKYLLARVFRAKYFAPSLAATAPGADMKAIRAAQAAAWKAYYDPLAEVMEAPGNLWPEQNLSNAVAKKRAWVLLQDPESNNVIPPPGAKNAYKEDDDGGDWGGGDDEGGDW